MSLRTAMATYALEARGALHAKWRQWLYMALLIGMWYVFSYAFNASLKDWFRATAGGDREGEDTATMFPVLLTVFFSNTVASSLWVLHLTGCMRKPRHALHGVAWFTHAVCGGGLALDLCLLCTAGAVGIAAACIVLQHGSIQLVQVSRSMGPMFTAVWAFLILGQATHGRALLALGLALAGTALASWHEPTFSALTFCLMLVVNTTLTFRNAATKRILRLSLPSLPTLLPHHYPSKVAGGAAAAEEATAARGSLLQAPEVLSCVLLAATNAVGLAGVVLLWAGWTAWSGELVAGAADGDGSSGGGGLAARMARLMALPNDAAWMLLAWLGFANFMYNMASQIVLAHVHVVSHGMLELFKRVFVLLAASALLGDVSWAPHNALGAALATAGTVLYFCVVGGTGTSGGGAHHHAASPQRPPPPPQQQQQHNGGAGKGSVDDNSNSATWSLKPHVSASDAFGLKDRQQHASDGSSGGGHRLDGGALPLSPSAPPLPPSDSTRKKQHGPDRWSGGSSGGGWGGSGTAQRRLQLANGLVALMLLLSPVLFLESMGVSRWTPAWLRTEQPRAVGVADGGGNGDGGSSGGDAVAELSLWDGPVTAQALVMLARDPFAQGVAASLSGSNSSDGGGAGVGSAQGAPGGDNTVAAAANAAATVDSILGNVLLMPNAMHLASLRVDPPDASLYAPAPDKGLGAPLRGGPYHEGLLPYHRTLARASQSAFASVCQVAGGDGGAAAARGGVQQGEARQLATVPRFPLEVAAAERQAARGLPSRPRDLVKVARDGSSGSSRNILGPVLPVEQQNQQRRRLYAGDPAARFVGVYTGWLGHDNLGDDIVSDIFLDLFAAALLEATGGGTCVTLERASRELAASGGRGCTLANVSSACDFGILGGGSTVYVDYVRRVAGTLAAGRPIVLFGSGFQSGLVPKGSNERFLELLCEGLLVGGARGVYTQGHLQKHGCHRTPVIRDSALLAATLYGGGRTALRPQLQAHAGVRHVLVVTLNNDTMHVFNSAIHKLLNTGRFAVVLQAVDEDSAALHTAYAAAINANRPAGSPQVLAHDEYTDWAAVLDLYRHASASLNSRLHSGVLSASALRPPLYVATNIKYKDFMATLNMRAKLVDAGRRKHVNAGPRQFGEYVAALVVDAIRQSSVLRKQLRLAEEETMQSYKAAMADLLLQLERLDPARFRALLCCKHIRVVRSTAHDKRVLIRVECDSSSHQTTSCT